jgi:hypothetical protein
MPDLGIEMLGWNYGTGGTDWKFWDEDGHTGHYAFACFRFHSASLGKFDCLVYAVTGSSISHTGSVYVDSNNSTDSNSSYSSVGIAFACHPSGSVTNTYPDTAGPWDGGYGAGTWIQTTTALWKTKVNGKGAFFPRPNGKFGANADNRAALQGIGGYQMSPSRAHFVLSEDSVTILTDAGVDGDCRMMHFGPYTPRSGVLAESPYVMWSSGDEDNYSPWVHGWTSTIGNISRQNNAYQGGLAHPNLNEGVKNFANIFISVDQYVGYNDYVNSGSWEKFPMLTAIAEGSDKAILGQLKHLYMGQGMVNYSVNTTSSSAAFGRSTLNEAKALVPWDGAAPGTLGATRTGRNFSIG